MVVVAESTNAAAQIAAQSFNCPDHFTIDVVLDEADEEDETSPFIDVYSFGAIAPIKITKD